MYCKLTILCCLFPLIFFAQINVSGKVLNKLNEPLAYATIQLIEQETDFTKDFTTASEAGTFSLTLPKSSKDFLLKITLLGYSDKRVVIDKNYVSNIQVVLEVQDNILREVLLTADIKEFQSKNDTIKYNISKIRDSTETNLKDLIEKLPGLTIDENKKVNFNGRLIDKVIIEGEDFFGRKHEMSTENLPAEAIKGIQIIKNFKEFDDIGGQKTGKIVLNITLNKNYKNKLVGNIEGNLGIEEKNQIHTNIFKFLKNGNFALITEANNVGESAINMLDYIEMQGGIGSFTTNYNEGGSGVYELDHAKIPRYVFVNQNVDARNTVFNSLNFSNKFSEKFKINGYLTLDFTKMEELTNSVKTFTNTNSFSLVETESANATSCLGNSFVNFVYKLSDKQVLKYSLKINPINNEENFNITGDLNLDYIINDQDFQYGQSLVFKNQLSPKFISQTLLSHDYKNQKRYSNIISESSFLNLDFSNDFILTQNTDVKQNTLNFSSQFLYELSDNIKMENAVFYIKNNEIFNNSTENQQDFLFDVQKTQNSFINSSSVNLKINKYFFLNGALNYIYNSLEVNDNKKDYNWLLPKLSLGLEFSNDKNLSFTYSNIKENISIFQMNNNLRVLNYQTKINKNDDIFTPKEKESIGVTFNSLNPIRNYLLNVNANFFKIKNEIGYNSLVKDNFIEQNYVRVPREGFDVVLNHSKTLKMFPLKWNSKIFYENSRSFSFLEADKNGSINYNYGLDLRFNSTFKDFPFQAKFDFYYSETKVINDYTILDFTLKRVNIYPNIYGKVKDFIWDTGFLYQNVTSINTSQNIYSVNFSTQWNFNDKLQYFFKGTNILNLNSNPFISQQNTEAFSQLTSFERLEGNILIGMRYNF